MVTVDLLVLDSNVLIASFARQRNTIAAIGVDNNILLLDPKNLSIIKSIEPKFLIADEPEKFDLVNIDRFAENLWVAGAVYKEGDKPEEFYKFLYYIHGDIVTKDITECDVTFYAGDLFMPGDFEETDYIVPKFKHLYFKERDLLITSTTESIEPAVIAKDPTSEGSLYFLDTSVS